MLKQVTAQYPNVEIRSFEGLLVDFARASGAHILIRGLRAVTDFEYELQMSQTNRKVAPELIRFSLQPAWNMHTLLQQL